MTDYDNLFSAGGHGSSDHLGGTNVPMTASAPTPGLSMPDLLPSATVDVGGVKFRTPQDPTAVKLGPTRDPYRLDMDPFGDKTVKWGKLNGVAVDSNYVLSANVFGKVMSREQLLSTDAGRRLVVLMEEMRNGHRRSFSDAMSEWSLSDAPFMSLVGAIGKSAAEAVAVSDAFRKWSNGEELTDDEAIKARLYMAEQERAAKGTWGSTVGDIIRSAPGFMLEFAATSGMYSYARAGLAGAAKSSASAAAKLSLSRTIKMGTRDAVERGFAAQLGRAAETATEATIRAGWQRLGTEAGRATVEAVKQSAVAEMAPIVKASLGVTDDMAMKIAASRTETEIARAIARNSSSSGVVRWARGLYLGAKDHVSRALLDFGDYGSELYSVSGKGLGSAMKTLQEAIGILGVEAPVRGAMVMMPQAFVVEPLLAKTGIVGKDGRTVSAAQLSLEASAARTGNKALMSSAESIASALNFLEYASENSGAGFGKLFRAAGLGLFGAKAMGVAAGGTKGLVPGELTEAAGSRLRQWINRAVGTTDEFLKGHTSNKVRAVAHALEKAELPAVSDDVIETFIGAMGSPESMRSFTESMRSFTEAVVRAGGSAEKLASVVGANPTKFIESAVREALRDNAMGMTYRSWARYALADYMARHKFGPEQMTSWLRRAGYDGIVEEMLEERYSDFVKGLFGLDDKSTEFHGFGPLVVGLEKGDVLNNVTKAFSNLNPGWDQLTAEAVGFAVPLGVRVAVHNIQRAAGGSELSRLQAYCDNIREFRGVNNVVEAETGTHVRAAREAVQSLRDQLRRTASDGTSSGLEVELEELNAKLDAENATPEYRESQTAALRERIEDVNQRIAAAERRAEQLESVAGSAEYNAERIRSYEALDTSERADSPEFRRRGTPTPEQARRGVTAHETLVQGAAGAGRVLAEARDAASEFGKLPLWRRAIARTTGILGALVTGDISMAQYDPMAWTAEDRGLSSGVVGTLADAYDRHKAAARDALREKYAAEIAAGSTTRGTVEPTDAEIADQMKDAYEREARTIMESYLAATGVRIFSRREMEEQARGIVKSRYGTLDGHEDEVSKVREDIAYTTLKLISSGAVQSSDARDITRGIINLSDDSPFTDEVVLDAALRLSGFRGLEETLELRPETDLKEAVHGRSLPAETVKTLAGADLANLTDEQQAEIIKAAKRLGYAPRYNADGSATMLYTPAAIDAMNRRVIDLCRKALAVANPRLRTYRKAAEADPVYGGAAPEYVQVRQSGDLFTWNENGQRKSVRGEEALAAAMSERGFQRTDTNIVFSLAREIRTKDPAVMLEKLGLTSRYLALAARGDAEKLASERVHPMFRLRDPENNVRYTVEEARRRLEYEVGMADRFRAVMNRAIPEEDKKRAFRNSKSETDAKVAERYAEAERLYKCVYGSEQEQNGYLPTIQKLLSAHGVELPGSRRSHTALLTSDLGWYTLNTRNLNFIDGSSYVFVDLSRDVDYDGALMTRAITNGLMANRRLWAYDPEKKAYPAFAGVVRDIVKRLDRVANDLVRGSMALNRDGEAEAMRRLSDMLTGGTNLNSPRLSTVTWIIRNAILGQADREAAKSKSTTHLAAASARLAEALRQTPEFYPFLGFADLVLGGDGFATTHKADSGDALKGVARLASVFSGDENFSVRDLVTNSMLPVRDDGTRMSVDDFLKKVNDVTSSVSKSKLDEERARKAAEQGPMEFVADLMDQAKLRTASDLRAFMSAVLTAAGVKAGNTCDLANWNRAIEAKRLQEAMREKDIEALEAELADRTQELEALKAEMAAGTNARVAELQAQVEELTEELNRLRDARASTEVPEEPEATPPAPVEDPDLSATDQDALDDMDSLGGDDYELAESFDAGPEPDTAGSETAFEDPAVPTLSPEGRRYAFRSVVRYLAASADDAALGRSATRDEVMRAASVLFPAMADVDKAEIFNDFSSFQQQVADETKQDEASLLAVREYLEDEKEEHTSDSDGWNDKAVAAYNSLKPMLEVMETAMPACRRNFQGMLSVMRDEVERLMATIPEAESKSVYMSALTLANRLISPRTIPTGVEGRDDLAARLAVHRARLDAVFGDSDAAQNRLNILIRELTKERNGEVRPPAAQLAAFFSFIGSIGSAGTRQSVMLLVSSSVARDTVSVDPTWVAQEDMDGTVSTEKTGNTAVSRTSSSTGAVSVEAATSAFLPLVGKSGKEVTEMLGEYRAAMAELRGRLRPVMFEGAQAHILNTFDHITESDINDPDARDRVVYTGGRVTGMLLQDIECFRNNAQIVAEALGRVLGQDNPLSQMLRAKSLYCLLRQRVLTGSPTAVKDVLNVFEKFGLYKDGMAASQDISSVFEEIARRGSATRDDVVNIAQTMFSTGDLRKANVAFPGASPNIRDAWLTLLDLFSESLPATVTRSRAVEGRPGRRRQVAVAAPGMIPIIARYIQRDDPGNPMSFWTVAERLVRTDAETEFYAKMAVERGEYVNPKTADAATREKAKQYADARVEELGGREGIAARSLQTMCWPDASATPIVASNLTLDYSPLEVGAACAYTYEGSEEDGTGADRTGVWYTSLFGGDHASNNLIQIPTARVKHEGRVLTYKEAVKLLNKATGVTRMMSDTKRSAITSATAAATPMVGADVEFNGIEEKVKAIGECRIHLVLNFGEDNGTEFSQEAMHGQTIAVGPGPEALRAMAKNPKLRISKFHLFGTGEDLAFGKSATSVVSPDAITDGGVYPPGTMPRAFADYVNGFALEGESPDARHRLSADFATDEDSYKVGPLKSQLYQVATAVAPDGTATGAQTILAFIKTLLKEGVAPAAIMSREVRMVDRTKSAKAGKPMKLSGVLPGLLITKVEGFNPGTAKGDRSFSISFTDNTSLALKVANIAHNSKPHIGSNGKNYTLDMAAKAIEQMWERDGAFGSPDSTAQNNVFNALTSYATLAAAVATEPEGLLAELESDVRLTQLMNNGADPGGLEYCKLLAETAAKRIRDSVLAPVNKINAVLVSCGAARDKRTGRILDHSASEMRRDIHLGSVVFGEDEVAPGALYEGFRRRLALAEVNNASLTFRYGMFLDVDALAAAYKLDSTDDKTVMECVEAAISAIVSADTEHNRLLQEATKAQRAAGADKTGTNIELTSVAAKATQAERDANSRRRALRRAFMSCFVDHHGENLGKQIVRVRGRGGLTEFRYRYDLVSFADLMVGRGDTTKFDRTALLLGQDMVKLDVYDFETGQLDEANSRGKMPFLAGSAFLAPRTPSYNGGMDLQIVRASLPKTERRLSDGSYAPGEDGLVALDPQTLDIEGSDNDGDESALASASPEADGSVRVGDMADGVVPAPDATNWQDNGFAASRPDTPEGKKAMLESALAASPDGVTYIRRRKDGRGFEFTPAGLRAVANQLITELVSMAHDAPVPSGRGRRQFAAAESIGLTKAQPFDDTRWWKREKGEEPGFEGRDRLVDFMPPDLFREGDTIGDPDLQDAVTLSAKKSGEARASIVSAASALHILFMSGCFVEKTVDTVDSRDRQVSRVNRFSLFREDLLNHPAKWRAFIRHFDGLSNATFDDVKERICQRLGLTAETVDILVCDLLSQKTVPTTDEEWFDALKRYVLSVRDRGPDGTQEWRPGMTSAIPEDDKSRLFMAKTADRYPNAWHDLVDATLFAGANGKERRRQAVMRFLGLDVDSEGRLFCPEPASTGRGILGRRFLTLPNARSVIAAAAENGGHNDVAGYIMWIAGRSFGNLASARDNKTSDLSAFSQNLDAAWAGFGLYTQRRQAWKTAKDFARALNFSQCDPGAADAARRAEDAGNAYAEVMRENERNLDPRCMRTIVAMRQAVRTAYSSSLVESATPEGRVVRAFGRIGEIEGGINTDLETAFRGRGDTAVADDMEALDLLVANAHEAGRTVFQGDMEACRDSMTSVPYVVAALQTMPRTGMVKSAADAEALLRGIASGVAHDGRPSALYLCKGIEALFSVMYASIATSAEGRDHPGITYLGTRTDGSFSSGRSAKAARGRAVKNYGIGSEALHKIFPTFSVRNEASLRRARAALDEVASGWFDGRARTLRYRDTPTRTTFDLTKDNIAAIGSERRGFDFAGFSGNAALATKALAGISAAMHVPVEQVRIRPSDFMRQLLPVYITMTQPVTGTPTYEQFTNSSLSLVKGLYRRLSRAQAGNDRSFDAVSKMYAPHAQTSLNLMDALATLDFSPVCVTDTWAAAKAACEAAGVTDRAAVKAKAEQMLADPSGLAQSRRTPENRTLVDVFAYNGALFRAARLYDALGTEAASRRDKATADAAVVEPLDAMDRPLEKPGETDPRVRTLADGFRQMLGATAGLNVSVEGNTITVSGRISGERALKRRGVSQGYVNTVVRIDVVPGGRVSSLNLESRATALSITHALRTAGVIDISVKDFLEVLDHEERMALVKRFMPEALAGQAGVAMRNPIWSVDGKGLYTLATAVKLRTASEKTAYHEYFHAMMGMLRSLGMLSDADAKSLSRHFGDARSSAELFDEEKAADAFAEYVGTKRKSAPKSAVTKFFARLLAFIRGVINAMTNNGFSYGTSIKVGDTWVDGKEQLFNVVLSGRAVDSSDSPKSVALDLKAARQVRDATSVAAGERLEDLLRTEDANPPANALDGPAQLAHFRLKKLIDGAERFNADFADNLIDTIAAHTGVTRERAATERGGDTRVSGPMEALSSELANTLGNAIPPGDGFFGDNPEAVRRSQRVGHGIAQAIARGLDALDPSVLTMLDANSDLTRIAASTEVQRVVFDGVFDAAETLGVDLKSKDQHLKNLVYGNALKAYDEIANNVGRYRGRIKILHAREHKGDFSRTKAYLSRSDVAAWLLTAGGLNYADIAMDTLGRLAEMRAMRNATPDFVRILDHLALNIRRLVNKRGVKGDPINEIKAGIEQGQRNRETGARGLFRENPRAGSAQAIRNRNMYHLADGSLKEFEPLVQEALDISLRTAFTLSAAKKFYDMMGIEPTSLTGDVIPGGLGERVTPKVRRADAPPIPDVEVAEALNLSVEDLLDDRKFIDPFCEVGLYVNNPGEWLASTCRRTFGGRALRDLFQDEHKRLKGATDVWTRKMNWWARVLGEDKLEGQPLLAVIRDKGHHVFSDGHVAYDETGHDRTGFDNYSVRAFGVGRLRGNTTDVALDRADKEMVDYWLKSIYFEGMGGTKVLTGVDGVSFTFDELEHPQHRRWQASDFSRDKVERMYNSSYVGREMPRMYVMLAELLLHNQVPACILDDSKEGAGDGLYSRVVSALVDALNGVRDEYLRSASRIDGGIPPSRAGSMVLKRMAAAGVLVNHTDRNGVPTRGTVCVPISDVETAFRRSAAYRKLLDAGRYEVDADGNALRDSKGDVVPMFTRERILKDCMAGYREAVGIAAKSPWMVSGDGRYFNNLGTAMPFFAGPGVFMYNANRIGRDEKKDVSARMNEYEKSFVETLKAEDQAVTDGQISFLHDLFDTGEDAGSALRLAIGNGEYEAGTAKAMRTGLELSPSDLGSSHKVAAKIYARLCEIAWADRGNEALVGRLGGRGSVARMIDIYEQAAGERTSTGGVGLNAEQMYQINGVLPANFQCFHAVTTAIQSLARTCQFRNTFVDFLFTADAAGRPVAYAKPSLTNRGYVDDGIPEEVWEYLARWWADLHGRKYDEGVSGRMNAARLYDEIVTANESKVIGGRHFRALPGDYRAALSSVSDFAAVDDDSSQDNVNARNALNGGETYGYAKMLFSIPRVVGGKAQSLLLKRVSAYSKTLSVQQSAFFQIATKIESPVGAVGFWAMFMSNFTPQAARNLDKFMQRFDKTFHTTLHDTLNRDFVGFKDVIEMMDTDDPFLADEVRLCDALGISLTDRLVNPYEDGKAIVQQDKQRLVAMLRASGNEAVAKSVDSLLEGLMFRGSERAFSYALNATKIATALQIAQKVRARCAREGRAFDIEKELKPYAAYINAEVGGIDPMRYAWANPRFRDLMSHAMFSWEWTKGAWAAGGGEVLEDMLLGGHMTNPETRAQLVGRWLRMYGTVMIGVPMFFQVLCKLIGLLLGWDDDDDKWWTWQNEQKIGETAFDITPLLKGLTRGENTLGRAVSTVVGGLKSVPLLGGLVPGYTGKDPYNTTGGRRFYMHFGKQGWEFFRWFSDPVNQMLSKLSMPTQRLVEGVLGYNPASKEYDLPFSKKSQAERWLLPTLDSATVNLLRAFVPFSWNSMVTYGDAGALSILGPVKMGTSYMAAIKEAEARLGAWAVNDRKGYQFGYTTKRNRFRSADVVTDILKGARLNGMDGATILSEASGLAAKPLYNRLYDLLPKEKDAEVDEAELRKVARGLRKLAIVRSNAVESLKVKLGRHNVRMSPEEKARFNQTLRGVMRDPFAWEEQRPEVHQAGKAGDGKRLMGNFLATDKVPDTIFGIPIVSRREDYTEEDIAFFREHPEAGGYYDLGGDSEETESQGALGAGKSRGAYPGSLNNPGNVEKRRERRPGEVDSPHERWAKFATPQDGLREMADAIRQIADVKLAGAGKDFTIRNFAEVYAPRRNRKGAKENDTDKYIRDVSSYSGLDADTPLARDVDSMAKLLRTVVRFESGYPHSRWFTDDEYRDAAGKLRKTSGR